MPLARQPSAFVPKDGTASPSRHTTCGVSLWFAGTALREARRGCAHRAAPQGEHSGRRCFIDAWACRIWSVGLFAWFSGGLTLRLKVRMRNWWWLIASKRPNKKRCKIKKEMSHKCFASQFFLFSTFVCHFCFGTVLVNFCFGRLLLNFRFGSVLLNFCFGSVLLNFCFGSVFVNFFSAVCFTTLVTRHPGETEVTLTLWKDRAYVDTLERQSLP